MAWLGLRHKGVEPLFPDEWNRVVDGLDILKQYTDASLRVEELQHLDMSIVPSVDLVYNLGDPQHMWGYVYAHYGYFDDDVLVQGRPVIKDGDPIQIYAIQQPAKEAITEAVDRSLLTDYMREVRDVVTRIRMDEYGRVGIIISEPIDEYGNVRVVPYEPTLRAVLREELAPRRSSVEKKLSGHSIDPGGVAEILFSNMQGFSAIGISVRASYDPNASAGVRVRWLYSPDGTNFDSVEDAEAQGNYEDLSFKAGETRQRTVRIPIAAPYVKVQIVNLDTGYAVTVDVWAWLVR